jgi:hypothetical protein
MHYYAMRETMYKTSTILAIKDALSLNYIKIYSKFAQNKAKKMEKQRKNTLTTKNR